MGLGVVGTGLTRAMVQKADAVAERVGRPVQVRRALVRDTSRERGASVSGIEITADPERIVAAPDIDIVVELMGGEEPAHAYISRSLHARQHVVTANKEVMAKYGPEVLAHAAEHGVMMRFEASVGGGIPIIGPLMEDLAGNDITAVNAVINGTTNFMLTRMAKSGLDYDAALEEAAALGYTEAEPSADVDGTDAAYKLAILSSLAFHTTVRDTDVFREGIRGLAPVDFTYAAELGYVVKLLATSRRVGNELQARVHPAFLAIDHPLAKVDGVYNAVELEGDLVDWAMFQGPGAGAEPTASAVLGDIMAIARVITSGEAAPSAPAFDARLAVQSMDQLETKYYLRLRVHDQPGAMAQITKVLGDLQVSLASVIQKEAGQSADDTEIVVTTHVAREAAVQEAVRKLAALEPVREVANVVRVEDHGV
jgi:homoserine dehydrogenase